jgi:hypothetical protein
MHKQRLGVIDSKKIYLNNNYNTHVSVQIFTHKIGFNKKGKIILATE